MPHTRYRTRRGTVQIMVALMGLLLIGFLGLSVDTAWTAWAGHQLQNSVESAAIAGALIVRDDEYAARLAAAEFAQLNPVTGEPLILDLNEKNDRDGDIVLGRYLRGTRQFDHTMWPNAVQARSSRTVNLFFGQIFGIASVDLSRSAIAMSSGGDGAALLVLHPTAPDALDIGGQATLIVDGGPIQVNSNHVQAVKFSGSANLKAEILMVVGGVFGTRPPGLDDILTGVAPRADPMAYLPEPQTAGMPNHGSVTVGPQATVTLEPGYYPGGITIRGTARFEPGIYIVGMLDVSSHAAVTGDGITIFVTAEDANNTNAYAVDITAGPLFSLKPPNPQAHTYPGANIYEGVVLFQKRGVINPAKFTFSGDTVLHGTWYFPSNAVTVAGSGRNHLARLIASELKFMGSATSTITFTGNQDAAGGNVFLVR
jgi:Flp pilus assembly protein TadG